MSATDAPIVISPYDPHWPIEFRSRSTALRDALGSRALRIDHIGSTSVVGLDAKPTFDIQISVATLEPFDAIRAPLEHLRYRFQSSNPDRSKRFFLGPTRERPVHVHVRAAGGFDERFNVLFRD